MIVRDAAERFPRRRSKVARWDEVLPSISPSARIKTEIERKHGAFALLTVLEMAYAAADIFPVDVLPESSEGSESRTLTLTPRTDPERTALCTALKLDPPAVRMTKILEGDELPDDAGWVLSENGSLGERTGETEWRFVNVGEGLPKLFQFEGAKATKIRGAAFLAPAGIGGQITQFRRRVKALKALRDHTELLRMFVDPRSQLDETHDPSKKMLLSNRSTHLNNRL